MHRIGEVEDIDAGTEARLEGLGLRTTDEFLARAATPAGRAEIAAAVGSSDADVLRWANCADLMRVEGIGMQFADLLEEAGVDTIPELAQRNAQNLHLQVAELNASRSLAGRSPSQAEVAEWVTQARALPRIVLYANADVAVAVAPAAPVAPMTAAPPPSAEVEGGSSRRAMAGELGDSGRTQVDDTAGSAAGDARGDGEPSAGLAHAAVQDAPAASGPPAASSGEGWLQRMLAKLRGGG